MTAWQAVAGGYALTALTWAGYAWWAARGARAAGRSRARGSGSPGEAR